MNYFYVLFLMYQGLSPALSSYGTMARVAVDSIVSLQNSGVFIVDVF